MKGLFYFMSVKHHFITNRSSPDVLRCGCTCIPSLDIYRVTVHHFMWSSQPLSHSPALLRSSLLANATQSKPRLGRRPRSLFIICQCISLKSATLLTADFLKSCPRILISSKRSNRILVDCLELRVFLGLSFQIHLFEQISRRLLLQLPQSRSAL